jgi:hypothetical protein
VRGVTIDRTATDVIVDVQWGRKFGLEAVGVFDLIEDQIGLPSSIVTRKGLTFDLAFRARVSHDEISVF